MHGWVKITPLQNTKIIFSQNSPAVRFQHQRFRKSEKKNNGFGFGNGPFSLTWVHLKGSVLFEALTTLYPHLTLSGGDCLKFQPEHNLVTCLAHLEYRGLHCIVLQLLDTNIRQVGAVLMLEMR